MLVIRPTPLAPAMVTASNAGALDADYNPATTYALAARVFLPADGRTYECVQAPALNKPPASSPLYWTRAQPSNRWAMWDAEISTATVTTGNLTATLAVGPRFNAVGVFGLVGSSITLTQKNTAGAVLWTETRALQSNPNGWYSYFYEPRQQVQEAVFTGLTPSVNSTLEVLVTATGGTAACTAVLPGSSMHIGDAQYGFSAGIISFSKKETNIATGVTTLKPGPSAKRMSGQLVQDRGQFNSIYSALKQLDGRVAVYVGVEDSGDYGPFTIAGFFRDFSIEATYPMHHLCTLEIEEIT
jgi:hypothetical protein